jgi:hypothetical protein
MRCDTLLRCIQSAKGADRRTTLQTGHWSKSTASWNDHMKVEVAMIYVRHPYRIKGNDLIKVSIEIPRPIYIRNWSSNMLPEGGSTSTSVARCPNISKSLLTSFQSRLWNFLPTLT